MITHKYVLKVVRNLDKQKFSNEILFFALRFCEKKSEGHYCHLWGKRASQLKEFITTQNLGLVTSCVNRLSKSNNVDRDTLMSDAFYAYARCIRKFKPELGYKWTTYVCNSIFRAMYRSIKERKVWSLIDPDESSILNDSHDEFPSDDALRIQKILTTNEAGLNDREMDIIRSRFYKTETYKTIGTRYKLTDERVRQVQNVALDKIKELIVPKTIAAGSYNGNTLVS